MLASALVASCSSIKRTAPYSAPPESNTSPSAAPALSAVSFNDLPGWQQDATAQVWPALKQNCAVLKNRPEWREACAAFTALDALSDGKPSDAQTQEFFSTWFKPWRLRNPDGSKGLVTGYYEPVLLGSRSRKPGFTVPLHGLPKNYSRNTLGFKRGELLSGVGALSLQGRELVWVNDPVDAFFLQVQGSGRITLEDGTQMRLGYAGSNGHPYRSIGKVLAERGELPLGQVSMQAIKSWAQANPDKLPEVLAQNPSYIFFRELPAAPASVGPIGSLGVPLTAERSIAVDPQHIALGTPVFLSTTQPLSGQPLQRLVIAQDTGSAIKGAVRADFFWGSGAQAGELAGRMKQSAEMWLLLPKTK